MCSLDQHFQVALGKYVPENGGFLLKVSALHRSSCVAGTVRPPLFESRKLRDKSNTLERTSTANNRVIRNP